MAEYQEFRSIMDGINTSLQRCERHEQQILSEIEVKKADIEKAYAPKLERVRIEKARLEQQRKVCWRVSRSRANLQLILVR